MSTAEPELLQPELSPEPAAKKNRALAKRDNGAHALEVIPHQPTMEEVLMAAVQQNASIETLERIQAMIERAQAAAARREFFDALSRFQAVMPVVPKRKKVKNKDGSPRFNYAPIEVMKEMAQPHLAANGLSVTSGSRVVGDKLIGIATANHTGGHSETREFEVPITLSQFMSDQQSFAAASSFAERCAFRQVTGIVCADEDNEARITPNEARAARQPVTQPRQTPTAQKAEAQRANGGTQRAEIEPAGEGEAIDPNTLKGLQTAMEHAKLGQAEFTARFPKLTSLERVKKTDSRVIMSWIADPSKN
jgi:hypothetical protein